MLEFRLMRFIMAQIAPKILLTPTITQLRSQLYNSVTPLRSHLPLIGAALLLPLLLLLGTAIWAGQAGSVPQTVKIGLVAPFEGEYRNTGYEVLFAVKLALQERNQGQGVGGIRVELVALNDFNDPTEAIRQARALVADPDVVGVVGHFDDAATRAALPVYQAAGLPLVIPWSVDRELFRQGYSGVAGVAADRQTTETGLQATIAAGPAGHVVTVESGEELSDLPPDTEGILVATDAVRAGELLSQVPATIEYRYGSVEAGDRQVVQVAGPAAEGFVFVSPGPGVAQLRDTGSFSEAYQAAAGLEAGPRAILAYDATQVLLDSLEQTMKINRKWYNERLHPRSALSQNVTRVQRQGLSGPIVFDETGLRLEAPVWIYQISDMRYPGTMVAQ
jgi:branched-chain amino acid transport system substrate-binding protein